MNFQTIKQNKNQKDGNGYGIKLDMYGVITKIKESKMSLNNKPLTKCEVTDQNNETHTVTFFGDTQPAVNMIGQRFVMSVSCEDYRLPDGRIVETYQAFLKSGNVSQNVPQTPAPAPQQPPQAINSPQPVKSPEIRIEAARIAATALGGTGVDEAPEVATKIIDVAGLLVPWLEKGQLPMFAAPKPETFEQQYDIPPEA